MGHQIADENRTDRIDEFSIGAEHAHAAEVRNIFRQRIDQPKATLFVERHQCGADDRLGHRIVAEDRVCSQRRLLFPVAPAELPGVNDDFRAARSAC